MTALPLRDFTAAEQDKLAAIEAAPAAAESLSMRVADALYDWTAFSWDDADRREMADAAIAVLSGPSSDADAALERVRALADRHEACCEFVAVGDLRRALAGD